VLLQLTQYNEQQWQPLLDMLTREGVSFHVVKPSSTLVLTKNVDGNLLNQFSSLILRSVAIETPYQLASAKWKQNTILNIQGMAFGSDQFQLIAGPCSVESEEQIYATAEYIAAKGLKFIRGGAYKPRTSPYSFRGLGKDGLKLIRQAADAHGLCVVTEIMDLSLLDEVDEHTDILQVGSRNMQNFSLLQELGKISKPVLLKRGMQAKVREWLLAAEYILCGGNEQVILCERGIRSFDPDTRNVMDLGVIPLIKELSHLPVIADPSHGTGAASRVLPMAMAAAVAGADGLIVEVHPNPSKALSDAQQAISFEQLDIMVEQLKKLMPVMDKELASTRQSSF
jgi:3-deoxy-7-phosphoheptulonate synthase